MEYSLYIIGLIFLLLQVIDGKKVVKVKTRSMSESGEDRTVGSSSNVHVIEIQHAIGQALNFSQSKFCVLHHCRLCNENFSTKYFLSISLNESLSKNDTFHTRGYAQINNLKTLSSVVSFDQERLTEEDLKLLQKAANNNDYYYLRARRNISDDSSIWSDNAEDIIMTLMSTCALMKSSLQDRIYIHGDGQGNIISLSVMTAESVLDTELNCHNEISSQYFSTKVQYTTSKVGPMPQVQAFLQKVEMEKAKKDTEDNRSFFQKYWLYLIIGFVGFQFLLSAGGAGGGGGS